MWRCAALLLLTEALVWTIATQEGDCFSAPESECPPRGSICSCRRVDANSVVCCNLTTAFHLTEGLHCERDNVTRVQVWNAYLPDLKQLAGEHLESLKISGSRIDRLTMVPDLPNLKCLNISNNSLSYVNPRAFENLPKLEKLALAHLNLTTLPILKRNVTLDLAGYLDLECSTVLQYIQENKNLAFLNEDHTFCSSPKTFDWFNTTESVALSQVQILHNVEESCTPNCRCRPHSFDMVGGQKPRLSVQVDCSGLGLTRLPTELPANTIALNVSNNNITSLDVLGYDPQYHNIRKLYADSNYISTILALEGTSFIDNFLVLSLRDNRISSLPTYILSNTFDRNYQLRTVNLGLNRFYCDCSVAQVLRPWLVANRANIPDYEEIACENLQEHVAELDEKMMCAQDGAWTDYIYYIIAAELSLLLLLVSKVSYDYWVFKTAGHLPWPASKMPKLPCDWVCE